MAETTTPPAAPEELNEAPTADAETENLGDGETVEEIRDRFKAQRKVNRDLERKLNEAYKVIQAAESEKLSDLERAQQAQAQAEKDAADARRDALRYRLAAKHGVSEEDAALFLTGDTEEAMTAQAERLAARTPETKTPKPDLTQGGGGGTPPALNSDAIGDAVARAVGVK